VLAVRRVEEERDVARVETALALRHHREEADRAQEGVERLHPRLREVGGEVHGGGSSAGRGGGSTVVGRPRPAGLHRGGRHQEAWAGGPTLSAA